MKDFKSPFIMFAMIFGSLGCAPFRSVFEIFPEDDEMEENSEAVESTKENKNAF